MAQRDDLASAVLDSLAETRRRAVGQWRVLLLLRRFATQRPIPEALPVPDRAASVTRRLVDRGDFEPVRGLRHVYIVTSPYAETIPLSDEQLIQEANPLSYFSHLTALAHHGLTDVVPNEIYATGPSSDTTRLPLGTSADDWFEEAFPVGQRPKKLGKLKVVWSRATDERGVEVAFSQGASIYVTNVERTLIDILRDPPAARGLPTVLRAWRQASETWNLPRLLEYTGDGPLMRQRVGYIVERLGQSSPVLEEWKKRLQRGGSLKMLSAEPYSSVFSAEWNLSLNVPESVLGILDD